MQAKRFKKAIKMKQCTKCKKYKENKLFSRRGKNGFCSWCKECANEDRRRWYRENNQLQIERSKKYRKDHPDKTKNTKLNQKYKISIEQFNAMNETQKGVCAICLRHDTYKHKKTNERPALSVDHDHFTGKVRGLLCGNCNRAIGLFKDSIKLMESAVSYLRKHKGR